MFRHYNYTPCNITFFYVLSIARNTEGTAPFLNTSFSAKVVRKFDGLKCSKQTFVLLEI